MAENNSISKSLTFAKENFLPQEEMLEIKQKNTELVIGIPKESNETENRICLTPLNVELLVNSGHKVLIQSKAGESINFTDLDYANAGGIIIDNLQEILRSDIVLKVSPFTDAEIDCLKGDQLIMSPINIVSQEEEYFRKLMQKKLSAISFEYLKDRNNIHPILRSMSEIVGSTSILIASEYLSNEHKGIGKMLGGITGVNPTEIVIIGAGIAGEYAAKTAIGLGALVKIFDNSFLKLENLQNNLKHPIFTSVLQENILANTLRTADVVIGAINPSVSNKEFIVSEEMVKQMKKGSVIVDISIDQGGCFETSKLTDFNNPVYRKHGVIHYCVPNIASRVARTASYALSNILTPIILRIAEEGGIKNSLRIDSGLRNGTYIYRGILTNYKIGKRFNIPTKDFDLIIAAL